MGYCPTGVARGCSRPTCSVWPTYHTLPTQDGVQGLQKLSCPDPFLPPGHFRPSLRSRVEPKQIVGQKRRNKAVSSLTLVCEFGEQLPLSETQSYKIRELDWNPFWPQLSTGTPHGYLAIYYYENN